MTVSTTHSNLGIGPSAMRIRLHRLPRLTLPTGLLLLLATLSSSSAKVYTPTEAIANLADIDGQTVLLRFKGAPKLAPVKYPGKAFAQAFIYEVNTRGAASHSHLIHIYEKHVAYVIDRWQREPVNSWWVEIREAGWKGGIKQSVTNAPIYFMLRGTSKAEDGTFQFGSDPAAHGKVDSIDKSGATPRPDPAADPLVTDPVSRQWTDKNWKTITATLVSQNEDSITIKKDGQTFTVQKSRLSNADIHWLRNREVQDSLMPSIVGDDMQHGWNDLKLRTIVNEVESISRIKTIPLRQGDRVSATDEIKFVDHTLLAAPGGPGRFRVTSVYQDESGKFFYVDARNSSVPPETRGTYYQARGSKELNLVAHRFVRHILTEKEPKIIVEVRSHSDEEIQKWVTLAEELPQVKGPPLYTRP